MRSFMKDSILEQYVIKVSRIEGMTGGEEIWTPCWLEQHENVISRNHQTSRCYRFSTEVLVHICPDRSGFHTASLHQVITTTN